MISRPSPTSSLPPELKSRYRAAIHREQEHRRSTNRLAAYRPYPKQQQFHAAGATFRERLFMAGNQLGKTLLWNSWADAQAPVSSGRGASAAADFAAHKTITLPDLRGRVVAGLDNL